MAHRRELPLEATVGKMGCLPSPLRYSYPSTPESFPLRPVVSLLDVSSWKDKDHQSARGALGFSEVTVPILPQVLHVYLGSKS